MKCKSTSRPQLLIIDIKDRDRLTLDQDMGRIIVSLRQPSMLREPQWFPVRCKSIKFTKTQGMVQLSVRCTFTGRDEPLPDEMQWTREMTTFMNINNFNLDFDGFESEEDEEEILEEVEDGEEVEDVEALEVPFVPVETDDAEAAHSR